MKTPREVLFKRHESAKDRLDDVRKNALAAAFPPVRPAQPRRSMLGSIGDQLAAIFQFKAQTGLALAAVWILIFAFKLATHDEARVATVKSAVPRDVMAEVRQQKKFFAELAGLREPRDVDRVKLLPPRPRSERHSENLMA